MADTTTQQAPAEDEAQALAAARAGYARRTGGEQPPTDAAASTTTAPLQDAVQTPAQDDNPAPESTEPNLEATTASAAEKPDPIATLTEQLTAMRAQVQELVSAGTSASEVRKLHGEIGNINSKLKKLQTAQASGAPVDDELTAALKQAEKVAEDYPEIAAPLVKALKAATKALQVQQDQQPPQQPEDSASAAPAAQTPPALDAEQLKAQARQQAAIDALNELHPDRLEINKTPAWKTWLAAKPPEYQKTLASTWNPAVLAKAYDEFKASQRVRQTRKDRLDAAAQPQGTGSPGGPTQSTPAAEAAAGYARYARRL